MSIRLRTVTGRKILWIMGAGIMLLLFLQIIFADNGVLDLQKCYTERDRLIRRNTIIKQENAHLYQKVYRLRNDPDYIESIARRELGMIREDEIIIKSQAP